VSSNPVYIGTKNKKWQPGTQRSEVTGESGEKTKHTRISDQAGIAKGRAVTP